MQQGVVKVTGGLYIGITRGRFWHKTLMRGKLDGLGCAFRVRLCNIDLVALVVFGGDSNVPAVYTML